MLTEENFFDEVNRLVSTKEEFISDLLKNNQMEPVAIGNFLTASMLPGHLYLLIWKDPPYHVWSSATFMYVISNDFIEQSYLVDLSEPPNDILVANYRDCRVIGLSVDGYPKEHSRVIGLFREPSKSDNSVMYRVTSTNWNWNGWQDEELLVYDLTSFFVLEVPSLNFPKGGI